MTPDQLKRLRELAGKATPGPYRCTGHLDGSVDLHLRTRDDAAYIAAADPTTVGALCDRLAHVERAAEQAEQMQENAEHKLAYANMYGPAEGTEAFAYREKLRERLATAKGQRDEWARQCNLASEQVADLLSSHAAAVRALEVERDGMAEALRLARERVRELEAEHEHCSTAIAYSEDHTREVAAERIADLEARLLGCVTAMELWGSWEDGVPEGGPGEHGIVGNAYDMAKATLGLGDANGQRIGAAMARMRSDRALGGKLAELEQVVARVRELASLQFGPEVFPAAYATRLRSIAAILPKEDT